MRLPVRVWLGVAALACGSALLAYALHSLAPRPIVVMDRPIRLVDGHFSTGPFEIPNEWDEQYFADIVLAGAPRKMPDSCDPEVVMQTAWTQRTNDKIQEGTQRDWSDEHGLTIVRVWPISYWWGLATDSTTPVHHAINMNFDSRSACLDAFHPHFRIETHPAPDYGYERANFFGVLLIALGVVLPVQGIIAQRAKPGALPRMFPEPRMRHLIPWRAQRPVAKFIAFPFHFAPAFVGIELVLLTIFMTNTPTTPQGLTLDLATRQIAKATDSPWPETLSLYVEPNGTITLNGVPVAKENLRARLQEELDRRMVNVVYIDADNNVEASAVISLIDTAQSLGAQVFWITPAVRKQWAAQAAAHPHP